MPLNRSAMLRYDLAGVEIFTLMLVISSAHYSVAAWHYHVALRRFTLPSTPLRPNPSKLLLGRAMSSYGYLQPRTVSE